MDVSDSPMSPETPPSAHGRWLPGGVRVPSTPPELLLNLPGTPPGTPRWLPGGVRVPSTPPEGQPHTLFLFRLKPKATTARAPGPGPIRKWDWKPLAWKLLKDRSIILHTDGAKAYKLAVPGVLHDNIVHKKKRIMVAGKATWVKPRYTKKWTHTLPGGKKLHVRAGTQIIDRFWGHLRTYLKHAPRKVGSATLMRKIRAAQWTYWYSKKNAWTSTATMVRELRSWAKCASCQKKFVLCMCPSSFAFVKAAHVLQFHPQLSFASTYLSASTATLSSKQISPHYILQILANMNLNSSMKHCNQWHILLEASTSLKLYTKGCCTGGVLGAGWA